MSDLFSFQEKSIRKSRPLGIIEESIWESLHQDLHVAAFFIRDYLFEENIILVWLNIQISLIILFVLLRRDL